MLACGCGGGFVCHSRENGCKAPLRGSVCVVAPALQAGACSINGLVQVTVDFPITRVVRFTGGGQRLVNLMLPIHGVENLGEGGVEGLGNGHFLGLDFVQHKGDFVVGHGVLVVVGVEGGGGGEGTGGVFGGGQCHGRLLSCPFGAVSGWLVAFDDVILARSRVFVNRFFADFCNFSKS